MPEAIVKPIQLSTATKIALCVFFVALAVFFLSANRDAYHSFFSDDDLDHMGNAREASAPFYLRALVLPRLGGEQNFRAAAHAYYWIMVRTADIDIKKYIAGIHAIHVVNVGLVFWLAMLLGAGPAAACGAALLLHVFHGDLRRLLEHDVHFRAAVHHVHPSQPDYVRARLSDRHLIFFWLALEVQGNRDRAGPVVLAAYEYWLGERKWKRIRAVLVAISVLMGRASHPRKCRPR
jgi:hypothetical protein